MIKKRVNKKNIKTKKQNNQSGGSSNNSLSRAHELDVSGLITQTGCSRKTALRVLREFRWNYKSAFEFITSKEYKFKKKKNRHKRLSHPITSEMYEKGNTLEKFSEPEISTSESSFLKSGTLTETKPETQRSLKTSLSEIDKWRETLGNLKESNNSSKESIKYHDLGKKFFIKTLKSRIMKKRNS